MGEIQLVTSSWYSIIYAIADDRFCNFGLGNVYEFEIGLNGIAHKDTGGFHSLRHDAEREMAGSLSLRFYTQRFREIEVYRWSDLLRSPNLN